MLAPHEIVAHRYQPLQELGRGAFGTVYSAKTLDGSALVALKAESIAAPRSRVHWEAKVLQELHEIRGVPRFYWVGQGFGVNVLSCELLGPSLETLFRQRGRLFSLKTTCEVAVQMLKLLKAVHKKGFVHRDVKPSNFLVGLGNKAGTVYIIDFGMAKKYRDEDGEHVACREDQGLVGTPRFASVNAHNGLDLSRRDDLESLAYSILYFCKGTLPWQGLKSESSEILTMKTQPLEKLCENCPGEVQLFLQHVRALTFTQMPDYRYLQSLFCRLATRTNIRFDHFFEWNSPDVRRRKSLSRGKKELRRRRESETSAYFQLLTAGLELQQDSEETVETNYLPQLSDKVRLARCSM